MIEVESVTLARNARKAIRPRPFKVGLHLTNGKTKPTLKRTNVVIVNTFGSHSLRTKIKTHYSGLSTATVINRCRLQKKMLKIK